MNVLRNVTAAVSVPVKNDKKLKLKNSNPPDIPPNSPPIGRFCIRADCPLIDKDSNQTLADLTGYDTDYSIVKRTQNACNRLKKKGAECDDPNITIIPTHKIKTCEGHIVYKNHIDNSTSIMFPK
jgi:hypothetical protein